MAHVWEGDLLARYPNLRLTYLPEIKAWFDKGSAWRLFDNDGFPIYPKKCGEYYDFDEMRWKELIREMNPDEKDDYDFLLAKHWIGRLNPHVQAHRWLNDDALKLHVPIESRRLIRSFLTPSGSLPFFGLRMGHAWYLLAVLMEQNDVPHWLRLIKIEANQNVWSVFNIIRIRYKQHVWF